MANGAPSFKGNGENLEIYQNSYSSTCSVGKARIPFFKTGEAITLDGSADLERLIAEFKAEIKLVDNCDSQTDYYCYSPYFKVFKMVRGEKINLHISVSEERVKMGTPIIFGSF